MLIDFSNCPSNGRRYGGSERKLGILWNGNSYMLKFQKKTVFGMRFNHISEYIGCHIYEIAGILCQETILGIYRGEMVVACRDFVTDGIQFVPFNDVGESSLDTDKEAYQYSYEDIMELLKANRKLTNVDATVSAFFDMFIIDALIGNFDRHGANWGFLKKNNKYQLAPVFDNGSCLYPNLVNEDEMTQIMNSEEEINKRVYQFPTSQIKLNGKKSSYFEVISSLKYDECNQALKRIYKKINLNEINEFLDNIEVLTEKQRLFYKKIIFARYQKIICYSYEKLKEKEHE